MGPVADEGQLVAARFAARDRRGEHESGVARVVHGHFEQGRVGFVEQLPDVGPRQSRRHEAEGRERRIAPSDRRVGGEHPVSRFARLVLERRARVGDDDDAIGRIDTEIAPRSSEGATRRIGLDRRTRLRRDDEDGLGETACLRVAVDGRQDLPGGGGVEDRQRHTVRAGDDLGSERRATHPGQHDARDTPAEELGAQRLDLGDERTRHGDGLHPAESVGRLGGGIRTPQVGVTGGDAARHQIGHEPGHGLLDDVGDMPRDVDLEAQRALSRASVTVPCRSCHDAMNLSTPSSSSNWVTSSRSIPTSARSAKTLCAAS